MTLQQQGSLETICKDCAFSEYEGQTQTGCSANRLEGFEGSIVEATDGKLNFFVIKDLCTSYRSSDWAKKYGNDKDKMLKELEPTFMVLFDIQDSSLEDLDKLGDHLESVLDQEKVKVVLGHKNSYEHKKKVLEIIHKYITNKNFILCQYHDDLTELERETELLRFGASANFFCYNANIEDLCGLIKEVKDAAQRFELPIISEFGNARIFMSSVIQLYATSFRSGIEGFLKRIVQDCQDSKSRHYRCY